MDLLDEVGLELGRDTPNMFKVVNYLRAYLIMDLEQPKKSVKDLIGREVPKFEKVRQGYDNVYNYSNSYDATNYLNDSVYHLLTFGKADSKLIENLVESVFNLASYLDVSNEGEITTQF